MSWVSNALGDNKEMAFATLQDYVVHFNSQGNTAANDTDTVRYFTNRTNVRKFNVRTDQAIRITKFNDKTLTDPILIAANKSITRELGTPMLTNITIRTTVVDTNVQILIDGDKPIV